MAVTSRSLPINPKFCSELSDPFLKRIPDPEYEVFNFRNPTASFAELIPSSGRISITFGDQLYVDAPVAVRMVPAPVHIAGLAAVTATVGIGFAVTTIAGLAAAQPFASVTATE